MSNIIIGSHVSFKKEEQLLGSTAEALSYGANTFMFYTGAPQNTNRTAIDLELTYKAWDYMKKNDIDINNVIVHAPYIVNLAGADNSFAIRFLKEEIARVEMLGISKIVLHPGSHVGIGVEQGINNIIRALNTIIDSKTKVIICLETMAGKGTEIGRNFEEIKTIIEGVKYSDKVMVCLDTCHVNDAGYDITDTDGLLSEFDSVIGLKKLACIHVNDSKNEAGASKDRHANIGEGFIAFEDILNLVFHPKLKDVPKILETPYVGIDDDKEKIYPPYKFEIAMIKSKQKNPNLLNDIRKYYK